MTDVSARLTALGDTLERAAAADLARAPRWHRPRTRVLLLAAALAILIPGGGAIAAKLLLSTHDVSNAIVAGGLIFQGTHPDCTVVTAGVEYHCVLDKPPMHEVDDFTGTVYQTVDGSQHVNGGCRSRQADGLVWECYIGEAAVKQQIVSQDFLGQVQTTPAAG